VVGFWFGFFRGGRGRFVGRGLLLDFLGAGFWCFFILNFLVLFDYAYIFYFISLLLIPASFDT